MKKIRIIVIILIILGGFFFIYLDIKNMKKTTEPKQPKEPIEYTDNFDINLIKTVNKDYNENYLISPYSIEIALNMLKDGANGNTEKQINEVIGSRTIPTFNVKERISVTNGAFIREKYKKLINKSYYEKLNNYDAEIIYDKFKTPDTINNWVKDKTYGMIPKILDEIDEDFVLGLANAVAIDVEWAQQFECVGTSSEEFTKTDNTKINVEMMHQKYSYDVKYFENEDSKGIIIPYMSYDKKGKNKYESKEKDFTELEFIGILPNDNVNKYIDSLNSDKLNNIEKNSIDTEKYDISVSLPRFSYSFDLDKFKDELKEMGITDVFNEDESDLTDIASQENIYKMNAERLYVSTAIHKTYIDLNEKGTKAAAVTYFGVEKANSAMPEKEQKEIKFNKPFIYIIRDTKTKEMLFFGVVEEPNKWKGQTCK